MITSTPTSISSSSTPTLTSTKSGGTITGGAIAGIVIGAILGLAGTGIGICKLWYMRKNRVGGKNASGRSQELECAPGKQPLQQVRSQQQAPQLFELRTTESAQELQQHEIIDEGYHAEMEG